jgi:SAM-dependent methyltransferase
MAPGYETTVEAALARTARRYRGGGRFDRFYVRGKLRHDPVYPDLLARSVRGCGNVIDVGCGRGQLGLFLLEVGAASAVLGLDRNPTHLEQARRAAQGLAFRVALRDLASDQSLPDADTVLLIDVLYQLDTCTQQRLLASAARAARRRVVIRTADPRRELRSAATRALEVLGRRVWPHAGAHVNARPIATLTPTLEAAGFDVSVAPCWRGTPFANVLIVANRCAAHGED